MDKEIKKRLDEIEFAIASHAMAAPAVFTQMKRLIEAPAAKPNPAESLRQRVAELERERNIARRTGEYWKAEHLAGNAVIESLTRELTEARREVEILSAHYDEVANWLHERGLYEGWLSPDADEPDFAEMLTKRERVLEERAADATRREFMQQEGRALAEQERDEARRELAEVRAATSDAVHSAPVVPKEMHVMRYSGPADVGFVRGWNACRAALLDAASLRAAPEPPKPEGGEVELAALEPMCAKCGQPTMHIGNICFACSRPSRNAAQQGERVAELEAEVAEQARLNGMGSEREARLMARVTELERAAGFIPRP